VKAPIDVRRWKIIQYEEERQPTKRYHVDAGTILQHTRHHQRASTIEGTDTLTLTLRTRDQRYIGQGRYIDTFDSAGTEIVVQKELLYLQVRHQATHIER
jgi:hypothetical protein